MKWNDLIFSQLWLSGSQCVEAHVLSQGTSGLAVVPTVYLKPTLQVIKVETIWFFSVPSSISKSRVGKHAHSDI